MLVDPARTPRTPPPPLPGGSAVLNCRRRKKSVGKINITSRPLSVGNTSAFSALLHPKSPGSTGEGGDLQSSAPPLASFQSSLIAIGWRQQTQRGLGVHLWKLWVCGMESVKWLNVTLRRDQPPNPLAPSVRMTHPCRKDWCPLWFCTACCSVKGNNAGAMHGCVNARPTITFPRV